MACLIGSTCSGRICCLFAVRFCLLYCFFCAALLGLVLLYSGFKAIPLPSFIGLFQ